jgi:hypothetical protein
MTSAVETRARRKRALEMHLAGATYDEIAEAQGFANRSGAYKAVQAELRARENPPPVGSGRRKANDPTPPTVGAATEAERIATQLTRIDAMLQGLWPKARRGDVAAVDRVLRLEERRDLLKIREAQINPPPKELDEGDKISESVEAKLRLVT